MYAFQSAPWVIPTSLAIWLYLLSALSFALVFFVMRTEREARMRSALFAVTLVLLSVTAVKATTADEPTPCQICKSQNLGPGDPYYWILGCWAC